MRWRALFVVLLAGCGRQADTRVQITYQTIETLPEQQAIHRAIVSEFERTHPAVRVRVEYDTSRFQKLHVRLAGNAGPDVFYYVVDKLPALARRGVVEELNAPAAEFYREVVEPCRMGGRLYLMPFHFSTDVLFFNRDWFERAGESLPDESWDWRKFAEVAKRLTAGRHQRFATVLPRPLLLVQSFGGDVFAGGRCVVNSPVALAALEFYRDLVEQNVAPTGSAMGEMEAFDGVNLFRAQKIPVLVGRTYMLAEFDKINDFRWEAAPVPKGSRRWSRLSVGGNCVWAGTKHPREAREFVEFYSTDGARLAAASRNAIPALRSAAEAAQFPPVMLAALEYSRLDNPSGYTFWDEFNQKAFVETAEAVALGRTTPAEALRSIEAFGNELAARAKD